MKQKIQILLPLALAILLPLFGMLSQKFTNEADFFSIQFYLTWLKVPLLLYILWYLLKRGPYLIKNQLITNIIFTIFTWFVITYLAVEVFEVFGDKIMKYGHVIRLFAATSLFLTIQHTLRINANITRLELEKRQIETENYKTQLQSLRTKVDLYFLFNSLNVLRIMVRNQHNEAEKFVMSLSDFYR